jgi:peptidoglycan/xylan/chitin deacetylase (PgdA/CDA1 family)
MTEETPEETMRQEIFDPIPVLEEHFGYRPVAYVWPGGNFTPKTIELAREAGFRIGFTAFSRGPVMFNWVPLGKPEALVTDPVMVLPRYWSTAAAVNLDQAAALGDEAEAFALANYPAEADWFRQTCGGELPPPPD